mmetsp:Transcript_17869/g.50331  ORF Transcript_17869/g.50331 Transcript_17869/m.50331 type:complete len:264 (-) Transcript_17869:167-958(-)
MVDTVSKKEVKQEGVSPGVALSAFVRNRGNDVVTFGGVSIRESFKKIGTTWSVTITSDCDADKISKVLLGAGGRKELEELRNWKELFVKTGKDCGDDTTICIRTRVTMQSGDILRVQIYRTGMWRTVYEEEIATYESLRNLGTSPLVKTIPVSNSGCSNVTLSIPPANIDTLPGEEQKSRILHVLAETHPQGAPVHCVKFTSNTVKEMPSGTEDAAIDFVSLLSDEINVVNISSYGFAFGDLQYFKGCVSTSVYFRFRSTASE